MLRNLGIIEITNSYNTIKYINIQCEKIFIYLVHAGLSFDKISSNIAWNADLFPLSRRKVVSLQTKRQEFILSLKMNFKILIGYDDKEGTIGFIIENKVANKAQDALIRIIFPLIITKRCAM